MWIRLVLVCMTLLEVIQCWCQYKTAAYNSNISSIEYSPDRSLFITTNAAGVAHIWSAANFAILTTITPASGTATSGRFNKNNTLFGVSTSTSMVYFYNSTDFTLLSSINAGLGSGTTKIDFSSGGTNLLICGGNLNTAKVFDLNTGATVSSISFSNAQTCVFAPNNNVAISASSSATLKYFTMAGALIWSQNYNSCQDLCFDGTSTALVMACNNGANKKGFGFDPASQTEYYSYISSGIMRVSQISGDSSYAAYAGDEKVLFIVSKTGTTYTMAQNFPLDSEAYSGDFSSDSNYLLIGTRLGYIYEYAKFCSDCSSGTYQNLTTLSCELCAQYNRACGSCINSTYCTECVQGYYLEQITVPFTTQRSCQPCLMEGCIICRSPPVCLRCEVGYYVTSTNTCQVCTIPMKGCLRCTSSGTCEQCAHDYYLNGGNTCTVCSTLTGCSLCSSGSYCHVCQIGYYFNVGSCTACPTNCLACYSTTTCQDCRQGYYPTNLAGAACSACPTTGCLSCNETGFCLECLTGRYYDPVAGACPVCAYPCNQCVNGTNWCIDCQPGFYLDYGVMGYLNASNGGVCTTCGYPCVTCNSSVYCLSCSLGFYLVSASHTCQTCDTMQTFCSECTPTACLNCTLGFYLNSSALCTPCATNMFACLSCTSISTCLKCSTGFYLTANTGNFSCASCPEGCQLCNSTTYCLGCVDGFYRDLGASNLCKRCVPPCVICSSSALCLECECQYYLNGSSCYNCADALSNCIACDDETASLKCISCRVGYYTNNGSCVACTSPCLICASAASCWQCEIGYYLSGTSCSLCPQNCTACTSGSVCSSCSIGFYFNGTDSRCYHCSNIGCLTCNSSQLCLGCSPGYYLTTTATCNLCHSSMKFCESCSSANVCEECSFGYVLNPSATACLICSTIAGCFDCASLTSCSVCENGYYLDSSSGQGVCVVCPYGCLTCTDLTHCATCLPGYTIQGTACQLCQDVLLGCELCTTNTTCAECSNGYYLNAFSTCSLCRSALKGCSFCTTPSVCTYCAVGFYLTASNTCDFCHTPMQGCQVCTSGSTCVSCENGFYLSGSTCLMCDSVMAGCIECSSSSTCLQCMEGYAINSTSSACGLCKTVMPGCIGCNSLTSCQQCEAGYYLRTTDKQCVACTSPGCEVCYQTSASSCVSCNTMYFLSASQCYYCRSYIEGCIECTSSSVCTLCQVGYFVNASSKCQVCQTSLEGCSKCSSAVSCYECKATYYLNNGTNTCQTCLSGIDGCAYCLDLSKCISCSNGYYKNSSSGFCSLCTEIEGCLACTDSQTCLVCQVSYFLNLNQSLCYPCNVIQGCYSCPSNTTCSICVGGYILNDDKLCEVYKVQADEPVKGLKLVSEYIDEGTLSHTLLANQMQFKPDNFTLDKWRNTTDLILQDPSFTMQNLTINSAVFTKDNELLFTTNNPLKIDIKKLPARRRLEAMPEGYKTFIKMKQDMINVILPDLYMSHSLVLDYDLAHPEFYTSIYTAKFTYFQSTIGIVMVIVILINYIVRAVVTCPREAVSEYGQILPHFGALKAPIFIIYPLFPQQISFCFGFMTGELPWARQFFSSALSDKSEVIPVQYSILYSSMSFASTYMLPLIIGFSILVVLYLYKRANSKSTYSRRNQDVEKSQIQSNQSTWGLPDWPLKIVIYNLFCFGFVFNGSASIQNVIYNPVTDISVPAVFNVIGIVVFALATADCLYSLYQSPLYFFKLRVYAKAVLLSVCHLSPIYIFAASFFLDLLNMTIEYRISNSFKSHPKLWLYNNIAVNLALALLVFIHSHFVTLVIAGLILLSVMIAEFYVHYQGYQVQKKKSRFILPKQFHLGLEKDENIAEVDSNIWNVNFAKIKDERAFSNSDALQAEHKQTRQNRRHKKEKRPLNELKLVQAKEESIENINSILDDNANGKNTFLAADFIN